MTIFLGAFPDVFFPSFQVINKALICVAVFIGDSKLIILIIEVANVFHAVDVKLYAFFAVADLNNVLRTLSKIIGTVFVKLLLRVLR